MTDEELERENLVRSFLGKPRRLPPEVERRKEKIKADRWKVEPIILQCASFLQSQGNDMRDFPLLAAYAQSLADTMQTEVASLVVSVIAQGGTPADVIHACDMHFARIIYEALVLGMHIGKVHGLNLTEDTEGES